ncbi:MAG: hypothetical protein HGB34_01520 [Candidatus Moranbacteria bacterium]|nr:hypothetical protein [Candidatus Moranbacteria bacterium]NTW75558.1 hypothetical protein [Candidatus Moranbacteria bacterium]
MPTFALPGVLLNMLSLAGASIEGVELDPLGDWVPGRSQEELNKYLWATMKHLAMAGWMAEDGLFVDE